tara:strand:+ start:1333 stop:1794 length:462 start_codon:yes stop_codon:yes gene_type:complete
MRLNNFYNNKWFVLYTKPKHELRVKDNLSKIGIECFCPTVISKRIWSDRIKKVKEVILKSIVFVKINDIDRNIVFDIPSTVKYLFYCNKPAVVKDNEIENLRQLKKHNYIINKDLSIGDTIFLHKVNQEGLIVKKTNIKTWINLKNINIRVCI